MYDFIIVGAGLAGSIMAERLSSIGKKVLLVEKRNHVGGNSFDEYDSNNILIHKYGPHIFHTNNNKVIKYLSNFTKWKKYEHIVLANDKGKLYNIPINIDTVNSVFNINLKSGEEMAKFLRSKHEERQHVLNSEDIIVNQVGMELFEKFYKIYTKKQWGLYPNELDSSVCGRIPVNYNKDKKYFSDKFQLIPLDGYYTLFNNLLKDKNIEVLLNTDYKEVIETINFKQMIYTGPIDYFFNYEFGQLPYRSLKFAHILLGKESYQEAAQINYVFDDVGFTRVIEHKKITGQISNKTSITVEYPDKNGEPYYPIPNQKNNKLYKKYLAKAKKLKNVYFCGRLAEYKYYNMDQVVANTLNIFQRIKEYEK